MKIKYWKSLVALAIMPFAFYFNFVEFYFAILFLIWSILGLKNKRTFLLDDISQRESPILFWMVITLWLILALLSLAYSEPIISWYSEY